MDFIKLLYLRFAIIMILSSGFVNPGGKIDNHATKDDRNTHKCANEHTNASFLNQWRFGPVSN